MIIHSIQAENFMKYRSLRISRLPEEGLICIVGDNESGKTTLGHMILFAIFGEAPDGDPLRLIHWDADQMKMGLEFSAEGHGRFAIYREIDRRGTNYVKLRNKSDEKDSCSGILAVGRRLMEMLGVTAEEFRMSFFMAQEDVDLLRPGQEVPSTALDRILGLESLHTIADSARESLEEVRKGTTQISEELKVRESLYQGSFEDPERELIFNKDIEEQREVADRLFKEVRGLTASQEALAREKTGWDEAMVGLDALRSSNDPDGTYRGIQELTELERSSTSDPAVTSTLEGLGEKRERLRASLAQLREYLEGIADLRAVVGKLAEVLYDRIRKEADRARRAGQSYLSLSRWIRRTGFLSLVFLVLGVACIVWWKAADQLYPPGEIIGTLFSGLEWNRETLRWGLGGAGGISLLLFYFLVRTTLQLRRRRTQEERLKRETEDTLRELEERKSFCVSYGEGASDLPAAKIEDLGDPGVFERLSALQEAHPDLSSDGLASSPLWEEITEIGEAISDALGSQAESTENVREAREEVLKDRRGKLRQVEEALAGFRQKQEMLKSLGEEKATLERDLVKARHEAKVHETLAREAADTAKGMRERFGPALARFLKPILPRVTAGRYSNVQVDSDLSVKVFSTDKSDFLSLGELSGGTLEQLLLAVRLGLSQALILSRGSSGLGAQFLFLDEPLPSSDRGRSTAFARLLQEMGSFAQVFITTQAREVAQEGYDLTVETRLDSNELIVSGSDGGETERADEPEAPPIA